MEMVLGVKEGQIRWGYFLDSILDPSVVDRNAPMFAYSFMEHA